MAGSFQCTVVTPESPVLDEQVTYADLPAHDGHIGFLPHRAPILLKLGEGPLRLELATNGGSGGGGQKVVRISGGFARMAGDHLTVLTDKAEL
ncbi:MAG: F0F1 ATP synthase subunit epsilon [Phycisphaeraceae bacterium]|nr:F0F1 ATP synthase subunit epsilon [Phycisphaeraceae bacterium]